MKTNKTLFLCLITILISSYTQAQYTDLPANIDWYGSQVADGTTTVDDVEVAYNNARTAENTALSTNIPMINFPDNSTWIKMSPNAQAFWIVNQERTARGIMPLEDTAQELITVASNYTNYLIDNDTTGHYADGGTPETRIRVDATCDACMTQWGENIGYIYSGYPNPPTNAVERMIYWLIYEDASANWGHRQLFFKENFTDDSGETGKEGIMGMGFVISDSYKTMNYGAITVFNIIDPCSSWVFPEPTDLKVTSNSEMKVFPTVTNSKISVTGNNIINVEIFHINGISMLTENSDFDNISISNLPIGTYIVKVSTSNGITKQIKIQVTE